MMEEILAGLLMQLNVLLGNETTKAPEVLGIISPSPTSTSTFQILPSTDVQLPSPAPSKTPVKKKAASKKVQISAISAPEVFQALNEYRNKNGAGSLAIDAGLQEYAQSRADYLSGLGKLDKHAGHQEFIKNGGFEKLGFNAIAENQSWNFKQSLPSDEGKGSAVDLIEKFYSKSSGHNKNQLNPEHTHVGVGINGAFTNLVFGGKKK